MGDHKKSRFMIRSAEKLFLAIIVLGFFGLPSKTDAANHVVAWGAGKIIKTSDYYDYGQSIVPTSLTNAVYVAGGELHSLAVNADGTLKGWGDDGFGQTDFLPGSNYVAVGCGSLHSVALETNGMVVATGDDFYGQTEVPSNLSNVVAIACGFYHTLALKSNGTVVAWGASADTRPVGDNPNYGQTLVPTDLSNVVAIASGGYHSLALKSDGTLEEWGDESAWGGQIPSGLSNVVAIATGAQHNVVLQADGTLVVWGLNTYGQTNVPPD